MAYQGIPLPSISASPEFSITANMDGFEKVVQEALDLAMAAAAEEVAEEARRLVPVDTGLLKESIHVARYEHQGIVSYQVETGPGRDNREYGLFVELGTVKTRAQPFLRPAMVNIRPQDRVRVAMKEALAAAARGVDQSGPPPGPGGEIRPMTPSAFGGMFSRAASIVRGVLGRVKGLLGR